MQCCKIQLISCVRSSSSFVSIHLPSTDLSRT